MIYRFSDCVVDVKRHELYCAGELVEVEPKVFEVLLFLLEQSGALVSRDALLERCWPGVYVSDGTLTRCISRVRHAIGHGAKRRLVETVHRKGYRFVGEVIEQPEEGGPTAETERIAQDAATPGTESELRDELPTAKPLGLTDVSRTPWIDDPVAVAPPVASAEPVASGSERAGGEGSAKPISIHAERRQLTVLHCRRHAENGEEEGDVEDAYQREHEFRTLCQDCFLQFDGNLAHAMQDDFVAYFGYPQAQEDSARRAVMAGVQLIARLQNDQVALPFQVQIGIHTGEVIVDSPESGDAGAQLISGPTQTTARRLSERASARSIVISEATARLIQGFFECQSLDPLPESGQTQPPACYRVVREHAERLQDAAPPRRGVTPFVGRDAELAWLSERWALVQDGTGQVVLISGDAGVGKSRLAERVRDDIIAVPHVVLECRCSPYHCNTAFFPLIRLLLRAFDEETGTEAGDLERIEAFVRHHHLAPDNATPLLAGLLSIPLPAERRSQSTMRPEQQYQQTLELLLTLLLNQAQTQPLLLIIEDLHWADPSTLELINLLVNQVPASAILVILTCRLEFEPTWGHRAAVAPLKLDRLNHSQIEQMLLRLTKGKRLPSVVIRQISAKADGVPLFIEELTSTLLESGQLFATEQG